VDAERHQLAIMC